MTLWLPVVDRPGGPVERTFEPRLGLKEKPSCRRPAHLRKTVLLPLTSWNLSTDRREGNRHATGQFGPISLRNMAVTDLPFAWGPDRS